MDTKVLKIIGLLVLINCSIILKANSNKHDVLKECWDKQVKATKEKYLNLSFSEIEKRLYNGMQPWSHTITKSDGDLYINSGSFYMEDSITAGKRVLHSKTVYNTTELLLQSYGESKLAAVSKDEFTEYLFETMRYSPVQAINYFYKNKAAIDKQSDNQTQYKLVINKTIITLFVDNTDKLVHKITLLNDDILYGDVLTTYTYSEYAVQKSVSIPQLVVIDKVNGNITDTVTISFVGLFTDAPKLLEKPDDFEWQVVTEEQPEVVVTKYNEHIHLIDLKHTSVQAMVVEFNSFLVIIDAPRGSQNGEIIISEAKKIAPTKPITFFSFGHRCPWALGGIRPFIQKGVTVLCNLPEDVSYLEHLATNPHTLNPDSQQLNPKPLKTQIIGDSLTITDGKYAVKIYLIGEKSGHTDDFMIYYFPEEKIVFEDHLTWIKKEGDIEKAGFRQKGLYNAIKDLHLDVETVVQSWPTNKHQLKTVFPFSDLETSVNLK